MLFASCVPNKHSRLHFPHIGWSSNRAYFIGLLKGLNEYKTCKNSWNGRVPGT